MDPSSQRIAPDAVQGREDSNLSGNPPSQGISSESIQRREDSGLSVDPPSQGTTVEHLVASVFEGIYNGVQSAKPSNYLSISDGIP